MSIVNSKSKYWIDIYDSKFGENMDHDGFWVAFLRRNIKNSQRKNKIFVDRINQFLFENKLIHIRIGLPYYDRLIVFTTCDKYEINKVKNYLISQLNIKAKYLYWKAAFESDDNWKYGKWLSLLQRTFDAYEEYLNKNNCVQRINLRNIQFLKSQTYQKILEEQCMKRESMIIKPVFGSIDYSINENLVFVLMPFGEKWSDDVYHLIKTAGDSVGMDIKRADDFLEPNVILDDIWHCINKAAVIIADITVHNANVFYELGIAHTLGKKVILIRQKGGMNTPFDITAWRYLEYGIMPKDADVLKGNLCKLLSLYKSSIV